MMARVAVPECRRGWALPLDLVGRLSWWEVRSYASASAVPRVIDGRIVHGMLLRMRLQLQPQIRPLPPKTTPPISNPRTQPTIPKWKTRSQSPWRFRSLHLQKERHPSMHPYQPQKAHYPRNRMRMQMRVPHLANLFHKKTLPAKVPYPQSVQEWELCWD